MSLWNWKKLWILLCAIPLLTACPVQPKLTLSVSQAVQGESVTASLEGLNGEGARVTVAGLEATVTGATRDSVTFVIPNNAPEGSQEVVILSGDQRATAKITIVAKQPGNQTFVLDRKNAARGETVNATSTGVDLSSAKVTVGGKPATIEPTQQGFTFKVPDDAPAGPQLVTLETGKGNLNQSLGILGDVVADKLTILLKTDVTQGQLQERLERLGFTLEDFRTLGASDGPCASALADIDVNGKPLGQAIEELEKEDVSLQIDPRTGWAIKAVDHLSAISASIARNNGYTGAGSTIAVLDTGVNEHPELTNTAGRLISPFNAITGGTDLADVVDDFDDALVLPPIPASNLQPGVEGHGTPIAVLAAGSTSGVASEASIMPIKAFGPNGEGFSNDVIVGVCHALTSVPDLKKLILNLSFGGDTPVDALEAILKYALDNGVQVAAAAGNEGEFGSPRHYPAAYNLPGLVAVGALEASSLQCVDFDQQAIDNTNYVIGSALTDAEVNISFKAFAFGNGEFTTSGFATLTGDSLNKVISTNNINIEFGFAYPVDAVSFIYVDQGGSENLEINGDLRAVDDLDSLDGEVVGGVNVSVDLLTDTIGFVRLQGSITQFAVGGQEFLLDNVCPSKTSAWQPAVFSTRGNYVDISAPGAALRSGTPDNTYANAYEGTSFSTPLVAGAMALWKDANSSLTPAEIEANLKRDAVKLPLFAADQIGAGLLNLNVTPFTVPRVLLVGGQ